MRLQIPWHPFDATGEQIRREGLWCIYRFGQQLDGMMFKGRWLRSEELSYPPRPKPMSTMKG